MLIHECFQTLKSQPTDLLDKITEKYHNILLENRRDYDKIQECRIAYEKIVSFLNNGYLFGQYSWEDYFKSIYCRCGSVFDGKYEIIECDSCSYYIIVKSLE